MWCRVIWLIVFTMIGLFIFAWNKEGSTHGLVDLNREFLEKQRKIKQNEVILKDLHKELELEMSKKVNVEESYIVPSGTLLMYNPRNNYIISNIGDSIEADRGDHIYKRLMEENRELRKSLELAHTAQAGPVFEMSLDSYIASQVDFKRDENNYITVTKKDGTYVTTFKLD